MSGIDVEDTPLVKARTPWYSLENVRCKLLLVAIFLAFQIATLAVVVRNSKDDSSSGVAMITDPAEINSCLTNNLKTPNYKTEDTTTFGSLLIQHATIWTAVGEPINDGAILVENGIITQIGPSASITPPAGVTTIIDAQSRIVTPGIIDLHSHVGVYPQPDDLWANQDGNEVTNPTFPQVRAMDGLNPKDLCLPRVLSGGITTSQILPGSANTMGGEATVIKLRANPNGIQTFTDLLIRDAPRSLKMACGENPKRNYGNKGVTPASRMGSAWVMRAKFEEAVKQLQQQTLWCSTASPNTPFPSSLALDPIISLMRGDALLHNHCYTIADMEMMIRLSKEFGFKIAAFHHAIDAYLLAEQIAANNITVAMFADSWNFKVEAIDQSVWSAKTLYDNGATVVMKSDYPVLNAQYLLYEAQKAAHYGLPPSEAIRSITYNPAKALTLDHRIGSIAVGMEADLVVWDRDPLVIGATPNQVIIDGVVLVDNSIPFTNHPSHTDTYGGIQSVGAPCNSIATFSCYVVRNVAVRDPGSGTSLIGVDVVVVDGLVDCIGNSCTIPGGCISYTINGNTGVVVPGFVEAVATLGLVGIKQESNTQDGSVGSPGIDGSPLVIHAADGIHIDQKYVRGAWAGGVTTAITRPLGNSVVNGLSVAWHTCCGTVVDDSLVINRETSIHLRVGNNAKSTGLSSTISGQIAAINNLFSSAKTLLDNNQTSTTLEPLIRALKLEIPVSVNVDGADAIYTLLRLQKTYGFRLVLIGGAEAHLVATDLAAATPPVDVIFVARPWPVTQENLRSQDDAPITLHNAGVRVGLSIGDLEFVRNIRWEAGMLREWGLPENVALAAITSTTADIFGLPVGRITVGEKANFLLFNGDPFSLQTELELVTNGATIECQPRQL